MINGYPVIWMTIGFAVVAYGASFIASWHGNKRTKRRKK
jgi:hypothetical protein